MAAMVNTRTICTGVAVAVLAAAVGFALGQDEGEDTFHVYRDKDLTGKKHQVVHPVTSEWPARLHALDSKVRDKVSSMQWNLPRGVIVVFYDHTNGTGKQFIIWGSGSRAAIDDAKFENKAGAWAWCYVDGWEDAPSHIRNGFAVRPLMTRKAGKGRTP